LFGRSRSAEIAHNDVNTAAVCALQSSRQLAEAILTSRSDDQIESVGREYLGESGADARGRTGNEYGPRGGRRGARVPF